MIINEDSIDDLLNSVFTAIEEKGEVIQSTKGKNNEIRNVQLILNNPRCRLSVSESRSVLISCIGEFCWYLNGSDNINFIEYYIKKYRKLIEFDEVENTPVFGAYGPRVFGEKNQFEAIKNILIEKPDSRRAVISIFSEKDNFRSDKRDIPCTCTLQFFIRDNSLHLTTIMRSNDAAKGLVHDIFNFTMFQELMWAKLKESSPNLEQLQLGSYTHFVGSLHIYEEDKELVEHYINKEGWQTKNPMIAMNPVHLEVDLNNILKLEKNLRTDSELRKFELESFNDIFWQEIAVILIAYSYIKRNKHEELETLKEFCSSKPILYFLNKRIEEFHKALNSEVI